MRVLIDTNIFIYREDDHVLSDSIQKLSIALQKARAEILIHSLSLRELKKDKDKERREIMLSKIQAYSFLETSPDPQSDIEYLNTTKGEAGDNKIIDDTILYAVYKDAVDFLITEDKGIHRKARNLGINDRVLLIDDALNILEGHRHKGTIMSSPALRKECVYNLSLNDPIFDSLKESYEGFEEWFRKVSREGRRCLVHSREGGRIGVLLIYKFEDEPIDSLRWSPSSGQNRGYVKIGSRYSQGVCC